MNRRPLSLALCLIVPFVVLIAGLGLAAVQGYQSFRTLIAEAGRGPVPPGFTVTVTETGPHTLWLHTYTIHEGTAYESGDRLPAGARVLLTDEATGKEVTLVPGLSSSKSVGSETAVSLGTFEARQGDRVAVQGTGISKPVILSIAPAKMKEVFRLILQVGGTAAISFLLAVILLIVLLHRRQRAIQAEAQFQAGSH